MRFTLEDNKCHIMGILNVTPDSFFDGGKYTDLDKIMIRVDQMINEGVDIIDIGGESSRPGSDRISVQEELDRILPVVSKIRESHGIPISIDSMKPDVVRELLSYNINIINDISDMILQWILEKDDLIIISDPSDIKKELIAKLLPYQKLVKK